MRPQSAKAKGRRLQQWMCEQIIRKLSVAPEDCISCSMGAGGEDVKLSAAARAKFPYSVECKNTEAVNIWKAFRQCQANAPVGARPLVCIKRNGMQPLVVVDAEHFVDLVASRGTPEPSEPAPPPAPPPSPSRFSVEPAFPLHAMVTEACVHRAQTP